VADLTQYAIDHVITVCTAGHVLEYDWILGQHFASPIERHDKAEKRLEFVIAQRHCFWLFGLKSA
jgi:hypothetical protein